MKITGITATPVTVSYRSEYQRDRRFYPKGPEQVNVLIAVESDSGHVGYGEAAHSPGIYGDTAAATLGAVDYFRPSLLGCDPLALSRVALVMDRLSPIGNVSAKAGLDIAVHDLAGKILGIPVYQLLGGRIHESVPTHMSPASYEGTVADFARYQDEGYRFFKQKMSGDLAWDSRLITELLDARNDDTLISLDANQGWGVEEALTMARVVERHPRYNGNINLEQPIHARDFRGLAYIRSRTDLTVLADDAIRTVEDLREILELGAADLLSLKISRVGGLQRCRQMIAMAEAYNVPYIIDEINEMRVANAAVAHLAMASRTPRYCGVTCHLLLEQDIAQGGLWISNGDAYVFDAPGLGLKALDVPGLPRSADGSDSEGDAR